MSMIAVGIGVSTVASVGTGLSAANQQKKAAAAAANAFGQAQIDPAQIAAILGQVQEYHPVDVAGVTSRTAKKNAGEGVTLATRSARTINRRATQDVIDALNKLYGGKDRYESQRDSALANIADRLQGRVSASTRANVGRRLLASGVSDLGEGAVDDLMTGYLGQTQEALSTQGGEEFKSMYSTWRQAIPLISAANIRDRFTISPDNAVQAEIQNATAAANSSMAMAQLQFQGLGLMQQSAMGQANATAGLAQGRAAANTAMVQAIGTGIAGAAGAYSAHHQANQFNVVGTNGTTAMGVPIETYANRRGQSTTAARPLEIFN
jgi:hypothetical protein